MRFTSIRKAVAFFLLFALIFSVFPVSAVANNSEQAEETVAEEEIATAETSTERLLDETETSPDETGVPDENIDDVALSLAPAADLRAYHDSQMTHVARFFFKDGTIDTMKRMDYNGKTYKVFCLHRELNSGQGWYYSYNQENWYLGSYANDKKQAIGKILEIAYNLDTSINQVSGEDQSLSTAKRMTKELAVQLLIWEITEKETSGPYTITDTFKYKLNGESNGIQYIGFPNAAFTTWANNYYVASELDIGAAVAYYDQIKQEYNKTINPPALPSFAGATSTAIDPYSMTYNSSAGRYELKLTDTNNVLSRYTPSCNNSDVTFSKSGNVLWVYATDPTVFNNATITLTSDTYQYTFRASDFYAFVPDNTTENQTCLAFDGYNVGRYSAYFRIKEDSKLVTFQKKSSGSASANACIADNDLYSLAGAEYKVYTYKDGVYTDANDPLVIGSDGKATCKNKYQVNTVLYVEETKAPKGYKLTQGKIGPFKVTANGTNTFTVEDDPVFDPQAFELTKTGTSNQNIEGAIFKAEFFASTSPSGNAQRTWYFASDSNGRVKFDDTHKQLAANAGYTTNYELFKPDGAIQFPLGCIRVTEVKAAPGYILPAGNHAVALIKITQPTSGGDAVATWDVSGNNIYSITNNAVTAVNEEAYGAPFEVVKTDESNVPLEGAIFKVCYYNTDGTVSSGQSPNRTWYFKTDSNGYFTLDATHRLNNSEYSSDHLFATGKIPLGLMTVKEVKAPTGYEMTNFTGFWRMRLTSDKTAVECLWVDAGGQAQTYNYGEDAYVLTAEPGKLYVKNTTIPGTATMKKTLSADGQLEGYAFKLARNGTATPWYGKSDANGDIYLTDATFNAILSNGKKVYTFENLMDGKYWMIEYLASVGKTGAMPESVHIKTSGGITTPMDVTLSGSQLLMTESGDCSLFGANGLQITGLNGGGKLTIEIENKPSTGYMTMRKALTAGTTGSKEGYFFNVHRSADSAGSANTWYGRSDYNGNIYSTNHNHTEVSVNERVYTFEGMTDGTYVIRELMNGKDARTEKIRIYTSGGETAAFDHTYTGSDLSFENNGDCVLSNIPITGLNGGGTLTIEITNTPIYGKPFMLIKVDSTDPDNTLEGAIFKCEYYNGDYWNDDDAELLRTWYFDSDDHGFVEYAADRLVNNSVYHSDELFPVGEIPLGTMIITEEQAPEGYHKSDAVGYWVMRRSVSNPYSAECFWATQDGNYNSVGYGDSAFIRDDPNRPNTLYVKDKPIVKLNIFKTSPNSTIKDIEFTVEKQVGTTWQNIKIDGGYFKTNAAGQIIVDDSQVIGELEVGMVLRITENVPEGTICTSENPQTITLVAGDNNTVTFENVEISLKIYKTATNNKVKDIDFEVSKYVNNQWVLLGTYTTNASGQIDIETEHLAVGAQFRIKELVPVGTYCTGQNPKTITLTAGPNFVTFSNRPIELKIVKTSTDGKVDDIDFVVDIKNDANEWDNIGTFKTGTDGKIDVPQQYLIQGATYRITEIVPENYICTTQNPQTVTLNQATTTVNFSNKPFSGLEIIKTSPDGYVEGIEFVIEKQIQIGHVGLTGWEILDPKNPSYFTDVKGKIIIDDDTLLETGMVLRITENVPDNYICISENPKTITLAIGKNSVTFENIPVAKLSLVKRSDDGKVDGIQFKLEKKRPSEHSSTGLVVKERWDLIGTYTTHDGGIILPEEFGALDYDGIYRVTEIVPQGYICENPVQTFTAGIDSEGNPVTEHQVTFENRRIYGNLEITKVDESYPDHKLTGAEFTVIMSKFGSEDLETAIMSEVLDEQGNGTGVYRLEHIEYGTTCEIRETAAPEGYELSDEVWRVTIEEEKTYTITTPNFDAVINRQIEGQLSVHKEDAEHNAMSGVQFLLEYSVDEGKNWAPVQARTAEDPVLPGYCTSDGLTDGILTTGADGNIVFTGLALSTEINSNVTYRLTEVKTQNGNTLMGISVFEGPLTIDEPELSYKVVNESVFTMPRTGSNGFVGTGIAIGLAILAALIILLNLPRGKKNKKEII